MSLLGMTTHSSLSLNSILLYGCATICLSIYSGKRSSLLPTLPMMKESQSICAQSMALALFYGALFFLFLRWTLNLKKLSWHFIASHFLIQAKYIKVLHHRLVILNGYRLAIKALASLNSAFMGGDSNRIV